MGASSMTKNLGLPLFGDGDKPTWRGDWNGAMFDIDAAVPWLTPELFGAIGDGAADDSAAFARLIAALRPGSMVRCSPTATYRIVTPQTITGIRNLTWVGGRFIFAGTVTSVSGAVAALTLSNCPDFNVSGTDLSVSNQAQQYIGILVTNTKNGTLRGNKVSNARWAGISVHDAVYETSTDILIEGNNVEFCRFGVYSDGKRTRIIGNHISSRWTETQEFIDKAGVWDSSSLYYDNVLIGAGSGWIVAGNDLNDSGQSGIYAPGGVHDGTITGNVIRNNQNKGVDLGAVGTKTTTNRLYNIAITGNVSVDNKTGNIHGNQLDSSTIVGNVSYQTTPGATGSGILLNGTCVGNTISGNNVTQGGTNGIGIFVNTSAAGTGPGINNVIVGNNVTVPTGGTAYQVDATKNMVVQYVNNVSNITTQTQPLTVDLTAATGYAGRVIMSATPSADNTYAQLQVPTELRISNAAGTRQKVSAGNFDSDNGLTVGAGSVFLGDATTFRLPVTSTANAGCVWYDKVTGKLMYRDGVANVARAVTAT